MVYKSCQDLSARLFSKVGEEKFHYVTWGVLVILFLRLPGCLSMYLVWWWPDCWTDVEIPLKALQPLKQLLFSFKISYMILHDNDIAYEMCFQSSPRFEWNSATHHVPSRWDPSSRGDQMSGISFCMHYGKGQLSRNMLYKNETDSGDFVFRPRCPVWLISLLCDGLNPTTRLMSYTFHQNI